MGNADVCIAPINLKSDTYRFYGRDAIASDAQGETGFTRTKEPFSVAAVFVLIDDAAPKSALSPSL